MIILFSKCSTSWETCMESGRKIRTMPAWADQPSSSLFSIKLAGASSLSRGDFRGAALSTIMNQQPATIAGAGSQQPVCKVHIKWHHLPSTGSLLTEIRPWFFGQSILLFLLHFFFFFAFKSLTSEYKYHSKAGTLQELPEGRNTILGKSLFAYVWDIIWCPVKLRQLFHL